MTELNGLTKVNPRDFPKENRFPAPRKFMKYQPTIGLEIHVELKTKTKMFCASRNDPDEKIPNVNICPICMGASRHFAGYKPRSGQICADVR